MERRRGEHRRKDYEVPNFHDYQDSDPMDRPALAWWWMPRRRPNKSGRLAKTDFPDRSCAIQTGRRQSKRRIDIITRSISRSLSSGYIGSETMRRDQPFGNRQATRRQHHTSRHSHFGDEPAPDNECRIQCRNLQDAPSRVPHVAGRDIQMIDMTGTRSCGRDGDRQSSEPLGITPRQSPRGASLSESRCGSLAVKIAAWSGSKPRIDADLVCYARIVPAILAQPAHACGQRRRWT